MPLLSRATGAEFSRVLAYPKFNLTDEERIELLGDYLPYCEIVDPTQPCPQVCQDFGDQIFLDLAHTGNAETLISGDQDLLGMAGQTAFVIETPRAYLARVSRG